MPVPVPVSATVVGLFEALLAMVSVPVRVPATVGVNVTLTVQEALAAMDDPQVLVCEKSPVAVTPETDAAALPVLVTVTVCALLVVPGAWLAKVQRRRAGGQGRRRAGCSRRWGRPRSPTAGRRSSRCWR